MATPIWSSILKIFSEPKLIASSELFFSTANVTEFLFLHTMAVVPLLTASMAYSTWNSLPSGENYLFLEIF